MKIAFIYDCLYPYVKGGGEKRYYEIGQRLKNEHKVHFFSMKFWNEPVDISKNGIWYHGVCKPKKLYTESGRRSILQALYFGIKLFRPLWREKFDLIDCSAFPYFSIFPVWLYSKIRNIKIVFTWHEYWGVKYWLEYLGILGIIGSFIERLALFFSKDIIAVSEFTKRRLIKVGKTKKNIKVIPNGINLEGIERVVPSKESSDLIFAGRLIKEKNIDLLIRVVAGLRKDFQQIKCIIIGDGPEKENLIKLRDKLDLSKNIIFKGFLKKQEEVYSYFKSSKIFALLSVREGFGIVVLEANACGLPVITINCENNAAKDLVNDGYNGYISLDKEMISKCIERLLRDKILFNNLKNQSIEFARNYNWPVIINKLSNYYLKIINESNPNTG